MKTIDTVFSASDGESNTLPLMIENEPVNVSIVSGATCNLMSVQLFDKLSKGKLGSKGRVVELEESGLTLNYDKCQIGMSSMEYLGNLLSDKGLQVSDDKVEAIVQAQRPKDQSEL